MDDAQSQEEEKRQEEIAKAYRVIMTDPRYLRIVSKTAPKTFSVEKLKSEVDPKQIPIFGTFVKGFRSVRVEKHKDTMELAQVAGSENGDDQLNTALSNMDLNMKAEANKRHIGLAIGMVFSVVPVANLAPVGGSAASAAVSKGATEGMEEGIKKGAQKAGEKSQLSKMDNDNYESVVHKKYLMTKSFLLYIGGPAVLDDELYSRWESYRLLLKKMYGAKDEEDLPLLLPTDEQKEQLKAARKKQEEEGNGVYDLQSMGVSLLWLMWEMYECWDVVYFDFLKRKTKGKTKEEFLEEQKILDRQSDEEYLNQLTLASNPLIRRVNQHELDRVVSLMMRNLDGEILHPRLKFATESEPEKIQDNKIWYCTTIAEYFFKNNEIWGMEDPETLLLKAVVLLETAGSDRPRPFSVTGLAKAAKRLGTSATKTLKASNKLLNETRDNYIHKKDKSAQFIHFVGGSDAIQRDDNVKDLVTAIQQSAKTQGHAMATHVFEYSSSPCCELWTKGGFQMIGEREGIRFYSAL